MLRSDKVPFVVWQEGRGKKGQMTHLSGMKPASAIEIFAGDAVARII